METNVCHYLNHKSYLDCTNIDPEPPECDNRINNGYFEVADRFSHHLLKTFSVLQPTSLVGWMFG
jgi:hypothetical protein